MKATILILPILSATACGTGTEGDPGAAFLPLAIGNRWVFEESGGGHTGSITKAVVAAEELEGRETLVLETTQSNSTVVKRSNWVQQDSRVFRVRQVRRASGAVLTSRTYTPGFLRFAGDLRSPGDSLTEEHVRTEMDSDGRVVDTVTKQYTWLVQEAAEQVTVPAGQFTCLRIERVDSSDAADFKRYWYARGIGKVLEEGPIETERLVDYELQ